MLHRRLFSPSMIVALVALVLALGGVGYSATQFPKNSIGRAQLRPAAVTGSELARDAVTGVKVKDHSLSASDFDTKGLPGKVAASGIADRAVSATTADRAKIADEVAGQNVDGIASTIALGGTAKVVGADGGLEIDGSCSLSGQLTLVARSTTAHALVRASAVSGSESPASVAVFDDADLNPGEDLNLFVAHSGRGTALVTYLGADGHVESAVLGFGELTGTQTCTVVGTLLRT
jgi:hypothetical protein